MRRTWILLAAISATLAGTGSWSAHAFNIVLTNDDGWADIHIRGLWSTLTDKGHKVVLSAPAENMSGSRSKKATPKPRKKPCQFDSCPAGSGPVGHNASVPELNWVNSYPVTCMEYGIEKLAPKFFNGKPPDLAVTGINSFYNLDVGVIMSGTVGAAVEAVRKYKIPAVAFSGGDHKRERMPWTVQPVPARIPMYGEAAARFLAALTHAGVPYLPAGTWANVNMPMMGPGTHCESVDDFKFVLSRTFMPWPGISEKDVSTCGRKDRLPTGLHVVGGRFGKYAKGCYIAVSLMKSSNKRDASAEQQKWLLDRLSGFLDCLPGKDGYESLNHEGAMPHPSPSRRDGYETIDH